MTTYRRVVTGHDSEGRSIIASDDVVSGNALPGTPGGQLTTYWASAETMQYPDAGAPPHCEPFFPPVGGFRFLEFIINPDADAEGVAPEDPEQLMEYAERVFPRMMAAMDPDVPGMHRSETVDLIYVAEGQIVLELDDGSKTELKAGDTIVQSGTMHAWRNPWPKAARMIAVTLGANLVP